MNRLLVLVAIFLVLLTPKVAAYPLERFESELVVPEAPVYFHVASNSTLRTDTRPDLEVRLPPGYFMDESTHKKVDDELKFLQERNTRLTAENYSLKTVASGYLPGWKIVIVSALLGVAGGIYIGTKL